MTRKESFYFGSVGGLRPPDEPSDSKNDAKDFFFGLLWGVWGGVGWWGAVGYCGLHFMPSIVNLL